TVTGGDKVDFLIAANAGEPAKSIARVASGGELSRVMLAIKTVMADVDDIDTLVFDEIDSGISGRAAQKVGDKLRQIASSATRARQILCVTHLAQIASHAHRHLLIEKAVRDGRTYTFIRPLDREGRRQELARIISGVATENALQTADEMLQRNA
ncbi:MAG: DNA repair protein RecN, partial [Clostridia bacterium]|nr:DNA repair protein RecN [Clostridia bacterium]